MSCHPSMPMWTIYAYPKGQPTGFVARLWMVHAGGKRPLVLPTHRTHACPALEPLRRWLAEMEGLSPIPRDPHDDPSIVEVWL